MTADHEEIRNLLGRYTEAIDAGDLTALGALFADAELTDDAGTVLARGADAVTRLYEQTTRLHADGTPRTRHLTTNTIIELDPYVGTAEARSAYVVLQATDALALQPIITGRYRDRFERAHDGRWRFTSRAFAVDLIGDLTQHLLVDVAAPASSQSTTQRPPTTATGSPAGP